MICSDCGFLFGCGVFGCCAGGLLLRLGVWLRYLCFGLIFARFVVLFVLILFIATHCGGLLCLSVALVVLWSCSLPVDYRCYLTCVAVWWFSC